VADDEAEVADGEPVCPDCVGEVDAD
jgi:hypothetical protein